jgi:hypothetical protein
MKHTIIIKQSKSDISQLETDLYECLISRLRFYNEQVKQWIDELSPEELAAFNECLENLEQELKDHNPTYKGVVK